MPDHRTTTCGSTGLLSRPDAVERPPRFAATVPRQFVHRSAIAEVFLTGWRRCDDHRMQVDAQWPRSHSFHRPDASGRHDPLLAAETIRQTALLISHAAYGVPFDRHFLLKHFDLDLVNGPPVVGATATEVELEVSCTDVRERDGVLSSMDLHVAITGDGVPLGTGRFGLSCVSPKVYRRLRGDHAHSAARLPLRPPVPGPEVDRTADHDVVLSRGTDGKWALRTDESHPVLFDHPVDHVPGMVLLEAARQAAFARSGARLVGFRSTFTKFVELDAPCVIDAIPIAPHTLLVRAEQHGEVRFRCEVDLR